MSRGALERSTPGPIVATCSPNATLESTAAAQGPWETAMTTIGKTYMNASRLCEPPE